MFTGIVQGTAQVVDIQQKEDFQTHIIRLEDALLAGLELGASVAHNGCCLTVTAIEGNQVAFDLMQETLRVTNLGELQPGDQVNIERAARVGDEIGGHAMSGHIIDTVTLCDLVKSPHNYQMWFSIAEPLDKYIFTKGYIALDGASLTIGEVVRDQEGTRFSVNLIPETLARTVLQQRQIGDRVNVEIDPQTQVIVDTVERVLAARPS